MTTHSRTLAARALPQLAGGIFLTDAGLETELVFLDGRDLPCFAAFPLLATEEGRVRLARYYMGFLDLAAERGTGIVLETPTWRASREWGAKLGLAPRAVEAANRNAVAFLADLRNRFRGRGQVVISGNIGPRGDGYRPDAVMTPEEAEAYHAEQVATFAATAADMVSAFTMTHTGEAAGIVRAVQKAGLPSVISFTVETDGRLPTGQALVEAIREVDELTAGGPAYYMINCAHPEHFADTLPAGDPALLRIRGIRANASKRSHAELDEATELDDGDPEALGRDHVELRRLLPNLTVFGGCCGTDLRHVRCIAHAIGGGDRPGRRVA